MNTKAKPQYKFRIMVPAALLWTASLHAAIPDIRDACKVLLDGTSLVPVAPVKGAVDFEIPASSIEEFHRSGHPEVLKDTLFVIPRNDGEAERAHQILKALKAPFLLDRHFPWGAKLDEIYKDPKTTIARIRRKTQNRVKRIVLFELPAPRLEVILREAGFDLVVIDHHKYSPPDGDRSNPLSSIEQIALFLGWPMSRVDEMIAANDRGYLPALYAMGLSDDEIREVRKYDYIGQGKKRESVERDYALVKLLTDKVPRIEGIYIISSAAKLVDSAILKEELVMKHPGEIVDVLTLARNSVGFSGSPAVVRALEGFDYTSLGYAKKDVLTYGGGDVRASRFFGFKPHNPAAGEGDLISIYAQHKIIEVAAEAKRRENADKVPEI